MGAISLHLHAKGGLGVGRGMDGAHVEHQERSAILGSGALGALAVGEHNLGCSWSKRRLNQWGSRQKVVRVLLRALGVAGAWKATAELRSLVGAGLEVSRRVNRLYEPHPWGPPPPPLSKLPVWARSTGQLLVSTTEHLELAVSPDGQRHPT